MSGRLKRSREHRSASALPHGRGKGPGGQPTGSSLPTGRCPVPRCMNQIDRTRLMCRRDWYLVPKQVRDRVWRTWRSGQEVRSRGHRRAVFKAIAAAYAAQLPRWKRQLIRGWLLINPTAESAGCDGDGIVPNDGVHPIR